MEETTETEKLTRDESIRTDKRLDWKSKQPHIDDIRQRRHSARTASETVDERDIKKILSEKCKPFIGQPLGDSAVPETLIEAFTEMAFQQILKQNPKVPTATPTNDYGNSKSIRATQTSYLQEAKGVSAGLGKDTNVSELEANLVQAAQETAEQLGLISPSFNNCLSSQSQSKSR